MSLTIGVYKIPLSSQANRPNLLYLDISNPSSLRRRGVCCEMQELNDYQLLFPENL